MLYVVSIPSHLDWNGFLNRQLICVYVIDKLKGSRDDLSSKSWSMYKDIFNYSNFWILTPDELKGCKIMDVKWHKGETV